MTIHRKFMTFIWKLTSYHINMLIILVLCFLWNEISKNNFFISFVTYFYKYKMSFGMYLRISMYLMSLNFKKTLCKEAQYIKGICIPNVRSCQRFSFNNSMSFELCVTWGVYSISFFHWNGIFPVLVLKNNGWIQWIEGGKWHRITI